MTKINFNFKTIMSGLLLSSLFCFSSCDCGGQKINNSTIGSLDLDRYLGTWYEIARFDHSFERGLTHAKAHYSLNEDGTVTVTNTGIKDGKDKTAKGRAVTTDTAGLLRVSFFGPFYSDYRVMMLSDNYDYALVGSKSGKYLWILSRTKQLPVNVESKILDEATSRGYNIEDLIWVKHSLYSEN